LIACSVDLDREKAIDVSRELLAQYIPQQPHIARSSGLSQSLVDELKAILSWPATHEEIERARQLVPLELVHRVTASGTPEDVRAKVEEYRQHGTTCPILYAVGPDVKLLIDTFASSQE
jgi:5,10-methylenetetrahydromethanopterin reductase